MIIVEGPDGAGKSTLINQLGLHRVSLKSIKGGVGGDDMKGWSGLDEPLVAYTKKIIYSDPNTAFDRFHLSEVVYGPILRHRQLLDDATLAMLSSYLRMKQVPVILCLPPFTTTLANVLQEGRERPSFQTEGFLHQAYEAWKRVAPWATIVYDYTRDPIPTI